MALFSIGLLVGCGQSALYSGVNSSFKGPRLNVKNSAAYPNRLFDGLYESTLHWFSKGLNAEPLFERRSSFLIDGNKISVTTRCHEGRRNFSVTAESKINVSASEISVLQTVVSEAPLSDKLSDTGARCLAELRRGDIFYLRGTDLVNDRGQRFRRVLIRASVSSKRKWPLHEDPRGSQGRIRCV